MSKKVFKAVKKFLPLIGIVVLIIIFLRLDLDKIKTALLSINPIFVVLSMLLFFPLLLIKNYTWQLIQKEQKIKLSFVESLKIYMVGFFYSSITPGFLGHIMRVPYMKEKTDEPYGKLFVNIFIDTTLRTMAEFFLIIGGAILVIGLFPQLFVINIVVFFVVVLVALYFFKKERGDAVFHRLVKYFIPKKLKDSSYKFVDTFYKDFPRFKKLLVPLALGVLIWVVVFTQEYLIVYAMGVSIPYFYFIMLVPIANIAGYLPITVAGLGLREFTAILIFSTLFGVTQEEILVFSLVGFVITDVYPGLVGFFVTLTESGEKDKKDFEKMMMSD